MCRGLVLVRWRCYEFDVAALSACKCRQLIDFVIRISAVTLVATCFASQTALLGQNLCISRSK